MNLRSLLFWCGGLLLLSMTACGPLDQTTVINQDITFGTPAPSVTDTINTTPSSVDTPTFTFTIQNVATQDGPSSVSVTWAVTVNGQLVTPVAFTGSNPVIVQPNSSQLVSVILPAPGSAGSYVYAVGLATPDGTDSNVNNNSASVIYTITAGN